jgi:alpha-L-fucosidase
MNPASTIPYEERIAWFHQARFGMFIHYGLYTLMGRGEWIQWQERIPRDVYRQLANDFKPKPGCVDEWLDLAVEAGMKYAALTTKHHEGFCLFDTATTDFKLPAYLDGRDLVAEFVEGCRKRGLKVGLYLSNFDWNNPGYAEPERYPEDYERCVRDLHEQTRELLTNYGQVDLLWYDDPCIGVADGVKQRSRAEYWRGEELLAMIYELQPQILVNDRLGIPADLDTPEQHVTASAPGRGWESCMTIADPESWGWSKHAPNRKTTPELLKNLIIAASGEGNYLLNIGPMPDGSVEPKDAQPLREIGEWLKLHGEAVYGSQRYFPDYTRHWQGAYTRKGNVVYITLFRYSTEVPVPLLRPLPVRATLLSDGSELSIREGHNCGFVIEGLPEKPPVPVQAVIKLEFAEALKRVEESNTADWISGKV